MIGVVITNYERPHYLRRMFRSLERTQFPHPTAVVLVDDGSSGRATLRLLGQLRLENAALYKILRPRLSTFGVNDCLRLGWNFLLREGGCRYLANLDSDAIVTPDWLVRLLALYQRLRPGGPLVVTGFNTLNHRVLEWHDDYCLKESCGGINLLFDEAFYHEFVLATLDGYSWDWTLVKAMQARSAPIACCRPSVVEHIGRHGFHSNPKGFDQACDFPSPNDG